MLRYIGHCVIDELTKIEGEASANNRKAKLIFFYEWELTAKWKGTLHSLLIIVCVIMKTLHEMSFL